jgi:hypothetical protein
MLLSCSRCFCSTTFFRSLAQEVYYLK